jgi:membrane protease YdiL (CAAX protease family)
MAILGSLLAGLMFFLLTAAAEPVYRQGYPSKVSLLGLFSRRGFRTKTFFNELLLGLTLTFFFFAYQIAFYLLANKFGAWAPADVPYDDLLNTRFPWVAVLLIGFMPSISEEFMSRMFSIPFLQRYLKSTLLALIIPAFIWGFGHSTYPNQPFFIRGLEVGIAGILVGIVMLRWGIFAALVWHFTVDALYTALLLFRSSNSYFVISGAVSAGILVLPLLLCLLAYVLKRGFVPEAGLRNADGPMARAPVSTEKPKLQVVPSRYRPPSRRAVVAWAVIALLSLLVFVPRIPRLGSYVRFDRPARRAQQLADQALIDRGVNLKDFLKVTKEQSSFGAFTSKYILQRKDIDYLNAFWEGRIRTPSWSTRYFKPLQKEEYAVNTDPRTGALISISHSLAEEAPGPHLSSDSARTIAEGVLRAMGLDQSAFTLQESTAEEKKARRDHQFTWEAKDSSGLNLGDAKYRAQVSVAGDQVSSYSRFLKLPEAWLRDQQERVMWKTVCEVLSRILFIALGVAAAIGFVIRLKDRLVPWRPVLILSVVVALAVFLVWLNSQTTRYADYDTTTPLSVFQVQNLAGGFAALIGGFVATVLALAISFGLDPDSATLLNRKGRAVYAPVALSGLLLLLILDSSAGQLSSVLTAWFGRFANLRELPLPGGMTTLLPFVHTLLGAFSGVFRSLALFVMASYLWRHRLRWLWVAVALAAFLLSVVGDPALKTAPEVGFRLVTGSLYVVGGVLFIALVARNNLLFYALAGFVLPCYQNAVRLVSQGAPWFRLNGILVLATVALILLWLFVEQARQRATTGPTA